MESILTQLSQPLLLPKFLCGISASRGAARGPPCSSGLCTALNVALANSRAKTTLTFRYNLNHVRHVVDKIHHLDTLNVPQIADGEIESGPTLLL